MYYLIRRSGAAPCGRLDDVMRTFILIFLTWLSVLAATPAHAQTANQRGVWLEASPSVVVGDWPITGAFGARTSVGFWKGNYDRDLALGRSWGLGLSTLWINAQDGHVVAPAVELKRSVDLIVVGYRWRVNAGPEVQNGEWGGHLSVGGTFKYRPRPWIGPTLDAQLGAVYREGQIQPRAVVSLGVEMVSALRKRQRQQE